MNFIFYMKGFNHLFTAVAISFLVSCSATRSVTPSKEEGLMEQPGLSNAHIGICIFEPATGKYLYNYQADKYFVPASNTKLFALYAGLKNLGDSLPAIRYTENANGIYLQPTGDPSFLHPDFKKQPAVDFLQKTTKPIFIDDQNWQDKALGYGWSWSDYNSYYSAERSALPVYGNVIKWTQSFQPNAGSGKSENYVYSDPEINWKVRFSDKKSSAFSVERNKDENVFLVTEGKDSTQTDEVPFVTNGIASALELLKDTIHHEIKLSNGTEPLLNAGNPALHASLKTIYSQPVDSLYSLMMHRSDNFFADQVLLMVSNERLGIMDDSKIVDTLLKTDFKGLPQEPKWVDGSGLSRYNLFTPMDIVWLLNRIKTEIPWQRITNILPTGGEGTLRNYYTSLKGNLYAKTGTLASHVALSGYLTTAKGKQIIFSILVNNHNTSSTEVRRAVEKFLLEFAAKN